MTKYLCHLTLFLSALALAACGTPPWDDPTSQYVQRNPGVTLSAGNAHDANAVTHMNDPWPRYVQDRNIPANGRRMVDAVRRNCDVAQLKNAPPPMQPIYGQTIGVAGYGVSGFGGGINISQTTNSGGSQQTAGYQAPPPGC